MKKNNCRYFLNHPHATVADLKEYAGKYPNRIKCI
jgi:hypothetical protein